MAAKFFRYPFAVNGDRLAIPDPTQLDGYVSYQQGFGADYEKNLITDPAAKPIPRDQFNELMFEVTLAIQQYQAFGFPDFITSSDNGGSPYPYDKYAVVRFNDGSGVQLFISNISNNTTDPTNVSNWDIFSGDGFQPGDSKDYCGATLPAGRWLLQDGSIKNIADYPRLFAAIGNIWGGDGVTTFAVPDARRRIAVGSGGTGTGVLGNAVSNTGGSETHTLTIPEIPSHSHKFRDDSGNWYVPLVIHDTENDDFQTNTGSWDVNLNANNTNQVTSTGGGQAHSIIQPSMIVMKLIRY